MTKFITVLTVLASLVLPASALAHPSYDSASNRAWYRIDNVAATHYSQHRNVTVTWVSEHRTGASGDYRVAKGKFDGVIVGGIATRCVKVRINPDGALYTYQGTSWEWLGCWNL
jgi:glucose/arabinose dehydrogenase